MKLMKLKSSYYRLLRACPTGSTRRPPAYH